jgi:hypothetical protein
MGTDVEEETEDAEEPAGAIDLHPWAGHALPKKNQVYVVRGDNDEFKIYRVNFRCKSLQDATQYKRRTREEPKLPDVVPVDCHADAPVYSELAYACEELKTDGGKVEGAYKACGYDTALLLDNSWQEIEMTGRTTQRTGMKIKSTDQRKLHHWLLAWRGGDTDADGDADDEMGE